MTPPADAGSNAFSLRMQAGGEFMGRVGQAGRNIGEYWSQDNAQFEAGNPGTLARVGRSVNPVTGFGSALGAMHDGASKGSAADMGVAAAQAIPIFAAASRIKQAVGPMLATVANPSKTAGRAAIGTAGSVAVDESQLFKPGLRNGGDLKTGHGGHVPGTGKGDKIPAKYEPGEFVVSNAMLDKNPGLREQLHGLRADALADKGMTPEQADAKAVGPRGFIRAASGYSVSDSRELIPVDAGRSFAPPTGGAYDRNTINQGTNTSAPSNLATTGGGRELALTGDAGRATTSMGKPANPSFANGASAEAVGYQAARTGPNQTGLPTASPTPTNWKSTAGNIAKNPGLGAVGFGAARLMDGMEGNAPKSGPETRANVNAIPTDGYAPAPAAGQPTGWWDTNTGRNVSNTLNAVTPFLGPLAGTVRAGSNVSRLANTGAAVVGGMAAGATSPEIPFAATSTAGAGRGTVNPPAGGPPSNESAPTPAPAAASQQATVAEQAPPDRYQARSADPAQDASQQPMGFSPPTTLSSANDWQKRNDLRSLRVSANSITNQGRRGRPSPEQAAYQTALAQDIQAQYGTDAGSVNNATQAGANQRTQMTTAAESQRTNAANRLAQQRIGIDQQELGIKQTAAGFTSRSAARLESLQSAYEAAKPEDRSAIAEQLRVLTGKDKPDQFAVASGGQQVDANGMPYKTPDRVFNKSTGQFSDQGTTQAAKPAVQEGSVSEVNGKKAKFTKGQWVPF